jgi:hypothetical protein
MFCNYSTSSPKNAFIMTARISQTIDHFLHGDQEGTAIPQQQPSHHLLPVARNARLVLAMKLFVETADHHCYHPFTAQKMRRDWMKPRKRFSSAVIRHGTKLTSVVLSQSSNGHMAFRGSVWAKAPQRRGMCMLLDW